MTVRTIAAIACCAVCAVVASAAPTEAAGARAAKAGAYKGRTAQGRTIVFRRAASRLELLHFTISLRCRDGSALIDQESGFEPSALPASGAFREYQVGSSDKAWFRGRAHGRSVRGRIRVKDRWGHVRCDSGWVRFSAKRRH